jgi:hypothetical protein
MQRLFVRGRLCLLCPVLPDPMGAGLEDRASWLAQCAPASDSVGSGREGSHPVAQACAGGPRAATDLSDKVVAPGFNEAGVLVVQVEHRQDPFNQCLILRVVMFGLVWERTSRPLGWGLASLSPSLTGACEGVEVLLVGFW